MELLQAINELLGTGQEPLKLTFMQVCLRGIVVFLAALLMVRLGDKRFLPKKTAFDAILVFILASMLARAVNGSAPFFPTLGCGFALVFLHWLFARIAFHSHRFGTLIKGTNEVIIRDGQVDEKVMLRNNLTIHDLREDLRLNGGLSDPAKVKEAHVERNGEISVIKD